MNDKDSMLYLELFNPINWHLDVSLLEKKNYSTGQNYIEYKLGLNNHPIEAKTFYFDGKMAMFSKLYTSSDSVFEDNLNQWEYQTITYYKNGKLRSLEYNYLNNQMRIFYGINSDLIYSEQIIFGDTINGIFPFEMDSDFNTSYKIIENKRHVGTLIIDRNMNLINCFGNISKKELKKKYLNFRITLESPY
jgi:hypothetical protein